MRAASIILASVLAIGIGAPASVAQQAGEGMITRINRLDGTVAIQRTQSGTVGATATPEEFKVQDGALLEKVHAGDKVTFSLGEGGGTKTITKLERQKN